MYHQEYENSMGFSRKGSTRLKYTLGRRGARAKVPPPLTF